MTRPYRLPEINPCETSTFRAAIDRLPTETLDALDRALGGFSSARNLEKALTEIEALPDPLADPRDQAPAARPAPAPAPRRAARPGEIETGSGYFDLLDPTPEAIPSIAEIATTLSRLCRFGGRGLPRFYSVAEHSILCHQIAFDQGAGVDFQRVALMHDAAEWAIGDITSPVKREIPGIAEIEHPIACAIFERFGIAPYLDYRQIDALALAIEKREFFPNSGPWGDLPDPTSHRPPVYDLDLTGAAREFCRRAAALGIC